MYFNYMYMCIHKSVDGFADFVISLQSVPVLFAFTLIFCFFFFLLLLLVSSDLSFIELLLFHIEPPNTHTRSHSSVFHIS